MSDFETITSLIEEQGKAVDELRKTNDARLAEIEKKGHADPLLETKLAKINDFIDDVKDRMDKLETGAPTLSNEEKESGDKREYKEAFTSYITKGHVIPQGLEEKALSVSSDPDGGYTVTPQMSNTIITTLFETSPMRQVASVETISTDSLEFVVDNDETDAGWVAEKASRPETKSPQVSKKSIPVHELYASPKATQKFLDDAAIDAEAWLAGKIADKLQRVQNTAFFTGDGIEKPRGILTYDAGTSWGQIEQISSAASTAGQLSADDFIELLFNLKTGYQANASYLMNRQVVKAARLIKDSEGRYIWSPGLSGTNNDGELQGKPVYQCDDMPVPSANSLSVACGDFSQGYQIADRTGIRVLRDPYCAKPFVEFYTTARVGGGVTNFEAIKLLKLDA